MKRWALKEGWLLAGILLWGLAFIRSLPASVGLLLAFVLYYRLRLKRRVWLLLALALVFLLRLFFPMEQEAPQQGYYQVKEIKDSYVIAADDRHRVILYGAQDVNFQDVLYVRATFERIDSVHNFHGFSFRTWAAKRGIYYAAQLKQTEIVKEGTSLQHRLYEKSVSIKQEELRDFVRTMLFGIQGEEDASYLLVSSGMHISLLLLWERKLLCRFLSVKQAKTVTLVQLVLFGWCFPLSSSLLRLLSFQCMEVLFHERGPLERLGRGMVLLLFLAPYMGGELSFVLPVSFRLLYSFHVAKLPNVLLNMLLFPIQLFFFHECNPLQLLMFRVLRIGYALSYFIALVLLFLPFTFFYQGCSYMLRLLSFAQGLGFFIYGSVSFWWLAVWFYVLAKWISYRKGKDGLRLCLLLGLFFLLPYLDPFAHVYMLDVGQGDCSVIILPFRQGVYMIDVMGHRSKNIPADIIVPFLHAKGITSIDLVLLTHQDLDHSGGLSQLQELIEVKEVIASKQHAKQVSLDWMKLLLLDYEGKDENDNSIVSYMELGNTSLLFTGDLGIAGEMELLKQYPALQADVLKAGHHGSATSSAPRFLHGLHPKLALVSSGRNNRYGHPHPSVRKLFEKERIYMLNSAEKGAVCIKTCKYFTFYKTADNEFGIITCR